MVGSVVAATVGSELGLEAVCVCFEQATTPETVQQQNQDFISYIGIDLLGFLVTALSALEKDDSLLAYVARNSSL